MTARLYKFDRSQTETWGLGSTFDPGQVGIADEDVAEPTAEQAASSSDIRLRDLVEELRQLTSTVPSHTLTLPTTLPLQYREVHVALTSAIAEGRPISLRRPNDVPMHSLLRFAAVLTVFVCGSSIAMWLADVQPLVNPFAALLGLVVSPFLYLMGRAARLRG